MRRSSGTPHFAHRGELGPLHRLWRVNAQEPPGAASNDPHPLPVGIDRWRSLELRHLLALSAIAREGTFSGAAEALGYSQSALSQQIATLERISRTRLLDRAPGRSPCCLTGAGRLMLRHADALIARVSMA